jgi:hypothetical protein
MLYVPLLFYLFDRFAERGKEQSEPPSAPPAGHGAGTAPMPDAPHAPRHDD